MRSFHSTLLTLLVAGAGAVAGCGTPPPDPSSSEPVGESHARLVLSMRGEGSATLRVTAKDEASGRAAIDQAVDVTAGEAVVLSADVPASSYSFHVDVFEDAAQTHLIGSADAHAVLDAEATTEIQLATQVDEGGSAGVSVGVNAAPQIDGVDVSFDATDVHSLVVHVDASDAEGDALTFFWSGAGISGSVQGGATINLSAIAMLAAASSTLHVIVQDAAGATAGADVAIDLAAGTAGQVPCGSTDACLSAHAQCVASCAADPAAVSCMADCGLALATCR